MRLWEDEQLDVKLGGVAAHSVGAADTEPAENPDAAQLQGAGHIPIPGMLREPLSTSCWTGLWMPWAWSLAVGDLCFSWGSHYVKGISG